ncbi:hypothetical protein [Geobacter sp. AOG1]|uniref:hypothetical protein n=1 Tax=Geobacter sp. AOG1 TaxID=1566346 RepID=UPI001CC3503F|nr:hypothetical protein [Geobacter sp. AOG1]GFE57919.1 hypothetical protein AOG1_17990 [Geobacter sp. AOG1]
MLGREGKGRKDSGKADKGANGKELQAELTAELRQLRRLVRDIGESFILRREGEIETLIAYLAALPAGRVRAEAPAWLRMVRQLKVKPAKGRLKDVKDMDRLIGELMDVLIDAQEKGKASAPRKSGETMVASPPLEDAG